ncbi:hypothetical protein [Methanocaldococcus sp.]
MELNVEDIKKKKEELIKIGDEKLRELSNVRVLLEAERKKNNVENIEKLEEEENKIVVEILRIDEKIKVLEVLEFITETKLFKKYCNLINEKIGCEKILDIILKNNLNIKKSLINIYEELGIKDREVLEEIMSLPIEEDEKVKINVDNKEFYKKLVDRLKCLKECFKK